MTAQVLALGIALATPGAIAAEGDRASAALLTYVDGVLQTHPRLLAAESNVEAASARTRGASRPVYNPELEAEYEDGESITRAIGISQTIDLGNKREAREQVASFEQQAAREELSLVQQQLSAELLSALGAYQVAEELAGIAGDRKDLMTRFRSLADQRRAAGDLNQVEAQLAELAYAEAALLYARSATDQVDAEQDLLRVTGATGARAPSIPSDYISVQLTEARVDATLNALPSVRVAQARVAASQATMRLRQRERRPDPTIGLYAGREGDDDLLGVRFSIPFPVRNRYRAEVDAASADLNSMTRSTVDQFRQLRAELIAAAKRYELSRNAWNDWLQVGAGSLDRQVQLLELLWRAGELSTSEYLIQLEQALDTQMAAVEQRGTLWADWIAWLTISGEIDDWLNLRGAQ